MSRLDKIIALVLASIIAGCVWLVSQSASAALFVAFGAFGLLTIGMGARPGREVAPRRDGGQERPIVKLLAVIVQLLLVFTAPATLLRPFGGILPESWLGSAKLFVIVAVLMIPFEWILGRLADLLLRARAPRRGS